MAIYNDRGSHSPAEVSCSEFEYPRQAASLRRCWGVRGVPSPQSCPKAPARMATVLATRPSRPWNLRIRWIRDTGFGLSQNGYGYYYYYYLPTTS